MISTFVRADRLRLATLFRSIEETRYYLNGVFIDSLPDGGVRLAATDGHRLAIFKDASGFTSGPCIVSLPKSAANAIKGCKHRDFVWFGILGSHDGTGRHEARIFNAFDAPVSGMEEIMQAMEDITHEGVVWAGAVTLIDGTFPDVDAVVPARRATSGVSAAFNQKYLAAFGEVAGDLGGTPGFRIYSAGSDPAIVDCGRDDFVGVAMPFRQDEKLLIDAGNGILAPPRWAKKPTAPTEVSRTA